MEVILLSKGEDRIGTVLRSLGERYVREKSFDGLVGTSGRSLRFDYWLPDRNVLIEFQGRQHYVPVSKFGGRKGLIRQQNNDRKKRLFCIKNNIRLISIPYYDEEKIDEEYISSLLDGDWR